MEVPGRDGFLIRRLLHKIKGERMMEWISREEYDEYRLRVEDERKRTNHRLGGLEEEIRQIGQLTASVEKLALSVESMAKTQAKYGERLEELENRDGEMWRKVSGYIVTTLIGVVLTFVLIQIGIG